MKSITRSVAVSMGRMCRSVRYATDSEEMPRKVDGEENEQMTIKSGHFVIECWLVEFSRRFFEWHKI